jgi:hypothetical protein
MMFMPTLPELETQTKPRSWRRAWLEFRQLMAVIILRAVVLVMPTHTDKARLFFMVFMDLLTILNHPADDPRLAVHHTGTPRQIERRWRQYECPN